MAISHTRCEHFKGGRLSLMEDETLKAGLMTSLYIWCNKCKNMIHMHAMPTSKKRTPRGMSYEVNRRSIYAAASLGLGHKGLSQFCAFLSMPPPVHHDSYQMQISEASVAHAEENMRSAVSRLKSTLKDSGDVSDDENDDKNDEACVDVGVSCDGSWHCRGFSSLVGTTVAISLETGQVLDYEILKVCYEC